MPVLGVTGTRENLTPIQMTSGLSTLRVFRDGTLPSHWHPIEWMHNGDCIGADHYAARIWRRMGGKIYGHPPSNNVGRAYFDFDKMDPPADYGIRDQAIVDASDTMIAFPKLMQEEIRSGTWTTVRMARKRGLWITFVWPNGSVTQEQPKNG